MTQNEFPLTGYSFLLLEDEPFVALLIADMVKELGGEAKLIAHRIETALDAVAKREFDCAILDVNVAGSLSYPVAEALRRQSLPYIFCTAYIDAVEAFPMIEGAPRIGKPVKKHELQAALTKALSLS